MSKARTMQELATKAHDMEVTIASYRGSSLSFAESKKDEAKVKKNVKFCKTSPNETMTTTKAEQFVLQENQTRRKRSMPFKDTMRRHPTLKELQGKKYSFPN